MNRTYLNVTLNPEGSAMETFSMFPERRFISSMFAHWGLEKCKEHLNDPTITGRTITQFIRQCPCCQVISRLKILIKSLDEDHIGILPSDDKGYIHMLHSHPGHDRCILSVGRIISH
jgi:hypothetical protein